MDIVLTQLPTKLALQPASVGSKLIVFKYP